MSSKFKITLKLQGFELQVEGSREDLPMLTKNVSAQLAGMLMPATNMVEGNAPALPSTRGQAFDHPNTTTPSPAPAKRGKARRTSPAADRGSGAAGSKEILWQHDANAWGTPPAELEGAGKSPMAALCRQSIRGGNRDDRGTNGCNIRPVIS